MLRSAVSLCQKANVKCNVLSSFGYSGVSVCSNRMSSTSVEQASEAAKAEAKRRLDEVVSVIGRTKPGSFYHEPDYNSPAFIEKYVKFFDRPEIDSWEIRRAIQDFADFDCIPDPEIMKAVLRACRRLNDYALAIRFQELVKCKCGRKLKKWYPYILQEIRPTLDELGIETPEELGYDKPEKAVIDIDDIH